MLIGYEINNACWCLHHLEQEWCCQDMVFFELFLVPFYHHPFIILSYHAISSFHLSGPLFPNTPSELISPQRNPMSHTGIFNILFTFIL